MILISNTVLDNIIESESCINFSDEWLNVADYELKLLILTSILAENNLAYRGTLTDMCSWLGVKPYNQTNNNIKQAIKSLQEKGYIFYKLDGRTWTLTISEKGMKEKQIVKIRKAWISAFKQYNKDSDNKTIDKAKAVDWIKILKIFVYLYSRKGSSYITTETIANDLNISVPTVSKAIKAICECNLSGLNVTKEVIKQQYNKNNEVLYYNIGTDIRFYIMFK